MDNVRTNMNEFFIPENITGTEKKVLSPSGKYELTINTYKTKEGCWSYSRGIVTCGSKIICDIKRNYSEFVYQFMTKDNQEWLICGRSYTGQTFVNLDTGYEYNNDGESNSFCWVEIEVNKDASVIAVTGCHWACSYEIKFYDFNEKDGLKELPIEIDVQMTTYFRMINALDLIDTVCSNDTTIAKFDTGTSDYKYEFYTIFSKLHNKWYSDLTDAEADEYDIHDYDDPDDKNNTLNEYGEKRLIVKASLKKEENKMVAYNVYNYNFFE